MTAITATSLRVLRRRSAGAVDVVLDGVSVQLRPGVATAVMGASGSGKSTLLLVLAGLLPTASGTVSWGGAPVRVGRRGRRRGGDARLTPALVPQRPEAALADERVDGDVGLVLRLRGASPELVAPAVDVALARCGLGPAFAARDPLRLSGGEQRRVAIAAAVAHAPGALLLDEPTAGLDAPARGAIARLVVAEAAAGRAVAVATHDPELALAACADLLVLARGRVAWHGPAEELLADADRCAALGIGAPPAVEAAAEVARRLGVEPPRTCDVDALLDWLVAHAHADRPAAPATTVARRAGSAYLSNDDPNDTTSTGTSTGIDSGRPRDEGRASATSPARVTERDVLAAARPRGAGLARRDARAVVVAAVLLLVAALTAASLVGHVALVVLVVVALLASRSDGPAVATLLRPVAFVVAAIVVAQLVLGTHHDVHVTPNATSDAPAVVALDRALQVLSVALVAIALTTTVASVRLADALGRLAAPLRPLRVPVDELATTAGLALGLVPATATASRSIELAMRGRGIDAEHLALAQRVQLRRIALGALAVAAFRRSRLLADALAIRGFHPSVRRTELAPQSIGAADVALVLVAAGTAALAIAGVA